MTLGEARRPRRRASLRIRVIARAHVTSVGVFASALAGRVDCDYLALLTWALAAGVKNSSMPRLMDNSIHLSTRDRNVL